MYIYIYLFISGSTATSFFHMRNVALMAGVRTCFQNGNMLPGVTARRFGLWSLVSYHSEFSWHMYLATIWSARTHTKSPNVSVLSNVSTFLRILHRCDPHLTIARTSYHYFNELTSAWKETNTPRMHGTETRNHTIYLRGNYHRPKHVHILEAGSHCGHFSIGSISWRPSASLLYFMVNRCFIYIVQSIYT